MLPNRFAGGDAKREHQAGAAANTDTVAVLGGRSECAIGHAVLQCERQPVQLFVVPADEDVAGNKGVV
jgi:hypothetical protein